MWRLCQHRSTYKLIQSPVFKCTKNSAAVWENRIAVHSAIFDHRPLKRWGRVMRRERPYFDTDGKSRTEKNPWIFAEFSPLCSNKFLAPTTASNPRFRPSPRNRLHPRRSPKRSFSISLFAWDRWYVILTPFTIFSTQSFTPPSKSLNRTRSNTRGRRRVDR